MSAADHRWVNGWFITDPLCIIFFLVIALYFVLLEGLTEATLGKWILGLRVVDGEGETPGLKRGVLRNLLRIQAMPARRAEARPRQSLHP